MELALPIYLRLHLHTVFITGMYVFIRAWKRRWCFDVKISTTLNITRSYRQKFSELFFWDYFPFNVDTRSLVLKVKHFLLTQPLPSESSYGVSPLLRVMSRKRRPAWRGKHYRLKSRGFPFLTYLADLVSVFDVKQDEIKVFSWWKINTWGIE